MKQLFVVPVTLVALMGTSVLAASQDQPGVSRTFGERVKILFGMQKRGDRASPGAAEHPAQQAAPASEQQTPVQTFTNVEIELDALGNEDLTGEN